MSRSTAALFVGLGLVFFAGCGDSKPTQPTEIKGGKDKKDDGHDHSDHGSGKSLLEDAELPGGKKCHAALTAHLAKDGKHALEVSFETMEKEPKPVALPEGTKVTARVTRKGDDKAYELTLTPGPKGERKADKAGECSRFETEAAWLKPTDKLTVTLNINGTPKKVVWVDFDVKKYSHEGE